MMSNYQVKLRKQLRSYRFAWVGSIFLAVFKTLVLMSVLATGGAVDEIIAPLYAGVFFWPAIAYICHLKIKLISYELRELDDSSPEASTA